MCVRPNLKMTLRFATALTFCRLFSAPSPPRQEAPPAKLELPSSSLSRTPSFTNFNTSPRAWNADVPSRAIKPVRPPSVLIGV